MQVCVEGQALVWLYRSLSSENRRNVIRYADAVRNIETLFQLASARCPLTTEAGAMDSLPHRGHILKV